jgi:hypothetical protein
MQNAEAHIVGASNHHQILVRRHRGGESDKYAVLRDFRSCDVPM